MRQLSRNDKRFGVIESLILGLILACIVIAGFYFFNNHIDKKTANSTSVTTLTPIPKSGRYWIFSLAALKDVIANNSAKQALLNDTLFVTEKRTSILPQQAQGLHIVATESFTSEASLASAIVHKRINPNTKYLLYDNEDWSLTPAVEQSNPLLYYEKAAKIAHLHGYYLIGTPVSKTNPSIAAQIAPYVDVLDIQSQYDQTIATRYASHVLPLATAAHKANSKLIILSGLSTNPTAGIPTPNQLLNDAQAVSNQVSGFWLNIPTPGTACPKCNQPQPQIAIQFLTLLKSSKTM